ncbi:MAG: helix-hairpin-helix domain-containing protein [Gemmatimonadota bacterium]
MQLSVDERRALGIIAALIVLAAAGRWLERPQPLLNDAEALDLAALQQASVEAKDPPRRQARTSSARPPAATQTSASPAGASADPKPGPIDLSTATPADLEKIHGVGPVLAARIAAYRDSLGGFGAWEHVDAVPGIGPAMLARLKDLAVLRR